MLIITRTTGYTPVQYVLAPEGFLTRLTDKHIRNVFLALVETQLVTDTHGQSTIPQQTRVIGLSHAINLDKDKALERGHRDVSRERLEGRCPVSLEKDGVLVGSRLKKGIRHHMAARKSRLARLLTIEAREAIPKIKFNCVKSRGLDCRDSTLFKYCS